MPKDRVNINLIAALKVAEMATRRIGASDRFGDEAPLAVEASLHDPITLWAIPIRSTLSLTWREMRCCSLPELQPFAGLLNGRPNDREAMNVFEYAAGAVHLLSGSLDIPMPPVVSRLSCSPRSQPGVDTWQTTLLHDVSVASRPSQEQVFL